MLHGRKHCFEKRCKGKHYFANFQIFSGKITIFAPKNKYQRWKSRKQNLC